MADLRESVKFPYKGELDHAVGCAVKTIGPRAVLSAIPLQITGQRFANSFIFYICSTLFRPLHFKFKVCIYI